MVWIILVAAGLMEVVGAVALKYTNGFTHKGFTALVFAAFGLSLYLLSTAATILPIGTAYAVWTGIGAVGTAIFGMLYLNEPRNALRLASLSLVILGSVGIKAFS